MALEIIMKKLLRTFGFCRRNDLSCNIKSDERGFVALELAIGLPLIVIMLGLFSNLFINNWQRCKFIVADFILQQDMESALARIASDARMAYDVILPNSGELIFKHHTMISKAKVENTEETKNGKPWYKLKDGKIYRNGESSPMTGNDSIARTYVSKFEFKQVPGHNKLLYIRLEARSLVSNHKLVLTTEVFMKGYRNE